MNINWNQELNVYYQDLNGRELLVLDHIPEDMILVRYKNFSGNKFRENGQRQFGIKLSEELAEQLRSDGWYIVHKAPTKEDETWDPYDVLNVTLRYDKYPPTVFTASESMPRYCSLRESTVGSLDSSMIKMIDLRVSGSWYKDRFTGTEYKKAYVDLMCAYLEEDPFANRFIFAEEEYPEDEDPDEEVPFR